MLLNSRLDRSSQTKISLFRHQKRTNATTQSSVSKLFHLERDLRSNVTTEMLSRAKILKQYVRVIHNRKLLHIFRKSQQTACKIG